MRSQQARPLSTRPLALRVAVAAWLLGWLLGLALALEHRFVHAGVGGGDEPHLVGGQHHGGDVQCQLVDQAALGDTLPSFAPEVAGPVWTATAPHEARAAGPGPLPPRAYEARAPPG